MLHRDMVPTLDFPIEILTAQEVEDVAGTRAKYLVSSDPVVGVTVGDQSRAYPISMLHVHELVHDELGGTPIVVTWHWPSASPRVFDRRIDGDTRNFGISGLVAGGNMVLYPRNLDGHVGDEPLISQLLGRSITGPEMKINAVPARFTNCAERLLLFLNSLVQYVAGCRLLEGRVSMGRVDRSQQLSCASPQGWSVHRPAAPVT